MTKRCRHLGSRRQKECRCFGLAGQSRTSREAVGSTVRNSTGLLEDYRLRRIEAVATTVAEAPLRVRKFDERC